MRFRSFVFAALIPLAAFAATARAQASMADGLMPGDYLRVSAGVMSPINAQGSVRHWNNGPTVDVSWENWQPGSNGVGSLAFAFAFDYSRLPFKESAFLSDFESIQGAKATSASATSDAQIFQLSTTLRARIPAPYIMPTLQLGFGVFNYQPGSIDYQTALGSGTTAQAHRTGGAISIGGGLDKMVYDRFGIFADAVYTYAFTSVGGQAIESASGVCSSCDAFKNTSTGVVRGGLRVRLGR